MKLPPLSPKLCDPNRLLSWRYSTFFGWTWAIEPMWQLDGPAYRWTIRDPGAEIVGHAETWHQASDLAMSLNNARYAPTAILVAPVAIVVVAPTVTPAEIEQRLADWADVFAVAAPKRIDP